MKRDVLIILVIVSLIGVFAVFSFSQYGGKAMRDMVPIVQDTAKARGETSLPQKSDTSGREPLEFRFMPNDAFRVGERFVFDVRFGFITAGEAIMVIHDSDYYKGRECYRIEFRVNSLPFFSTFYKVEDHYSSLLDMKGLFPWRFEQHIREGGYIRDFTADFDQVELVARTPEGNYPIPPYVHDVVSAFYFCRTLDYTGFRPGQKVHLQNFYKDSTFQLDIKYKGKQTIEVDAGMFHCIVIEPLVREGGLFKSEGSILVWLSDDERKIPVQVLSKIVIGSISAELREYSGVNGPITAKIE